MKVLDLFSGIGGFSIGLEKAGMETVAFCEIDPHACAVLSQWWPSVPQLNDIHQVQVAEIDGERFLCDQSKEAGEIHFQKIDVICGGFPCQDISTAGKQKGLIDEDFYKELLDAGFTEEYARENSATRSGLWFQYRRLIKEIKPKYVLIENVANLRSNGLVTVLQDLRELGYDAEWHVISAKSVGSWHERKRIWIIAFPNNYNFRFGLEATATKEEKSKWWAEATAELSAGRSSESPLCGTVDAVPGRLDITPAQRRAERIRQQRIKQLGNAVVPQIPELIGRAIMKFEESKK